MDSDWGERWEVLFRFIFRKCICDYISNPCDLTSLMVAKFLYEVVAGPTIQETWRQQGQRVETIEDVDQTSQ